MYLRQNDYAVQITNEDLLVVIEGDDSIRVQAELAAQQQIESYLRQRYDVAVIFNPLENLVYDAAATYDTGDVVLHPDLATGTFFTAKEDGITGAPNSPTGDPSKWTAGGDPRPELIKLYLIDLALYHLHSARNPRNIPTLRMSRRDEATKWLEMVGRGDISAGFAELDPEAGQVIRWASSEKFNHDF